jgi:hypothetical protein
MAVKRFLTLASENILKNRLIKTYDNNPYHFEKVAVITLRHKSVIILRHKSVRIANGYKLDLRIVV